MDKVHIEECDEFYIMGRSNCSIVLKLYLLSTKIKKEGKVQVI